MNTDTPNPSLLEASPAVTRKYGRRSQSPIGAKWSLGLFVFFSVLFGGAISVTAFVRVIQTLRGESPKTPDWSLELGLALIALGITVVVGGVAMWRRRQWGWWLMLGLVFAVLLAITQGAAISILGILIALWALRPQFGFPGPHHILEADIDAIAKSFGIDWTATPFGRIGELLASKQDVEATRLYRDHFGCDWDEAHAGIARWHTDTVAHKLRHLSQVVKSLDIRQHKGGH